MNAVAIGPLVLDGYRFAVLAGIAVFFLAAEFPGLSKAARARRRSARTWATPVLLAWLIGARLGFVALHAESFAARPLEVLMFWQGGFLSWTGYAAAVALLAFVALRDRTGALATAAAGTLAAAAFAGATAALPKTEGQLPSGSYAALSGAPVDLGQIDGPVVLNLWASWCPPCRREMPMMMETAAQTGNVRFLFANQGESLAEIGRFLAAGRLPAQDIIRDPEQRLMAELGAIGLPATLVFDGQGRLTAAHTGELSRAALQNMIAPFEGDPD